MPRSLKLRPDRIPTIKSTLLRNGFPSQRLLAEHLEIAQSTVSSFLNGKPVDYLNFLELCRVLGQEWQDIADLEGQTSSEMAAIAKATVAICASQQRFAIAFAPELHELAMQLQQALTPVGHVMLIHEKDSPLSEQLKQTDYLLLLLSEQSLFSEVLLENVRLAKELRDSTEKPALFPICVDFPVNLPLSFDLSGYLQDVQPWQWRSANDISVLASALQHVLQEQRIALPANHKLAMHWAAITASSHPDNPPQNSPTLSLPSNPPLPTAAPEIPGGQMDVASAFYIDRPPIEARCYEAIAQPGALIRIKAPRQMGKTSLMAKILHHGQQQGSRTVALSLQLANQRVFGNSDTFLQWFCASVSLELGLLDSEQLAKYWKLAEMIGSNQSCKAYFEQYLLPELSTPLTLGLDEVDRVFSSLEIADDFFGLLRALHEEAKRREIWKNFRLIVVHSTEVYIPLDINKSPFNVGLPVELPEFTLAQVQELARRYQLDWTMEQVQQLMEVVGGHPYLVRLAMYAIARQDITLNELLQSAPTESGIYSDHLRRHLGNLKHHPTLLEAFREVISSQSSVRLPSEQAFKLSSIGLVKLDKNEVTPRCHLYRQYFQERF